MDGKEGLNGEIDREIRLGRVGWRHESIEDDGMSQENVKM